MENVKAAAWTFLVEHKLNQFPIDTLTLNKFNAGFIIYTYKEAEELIVALELESYAKEHLAFTVAHKDSITICYNEKIPFSDRDFIISHEIGHIVLKHTTEKYILGKSSDPEKQSEQEKEADVFALAFLAPAPVFVEMKVGLPSEISRITRLPVSKAEEAAIEIIKEEVAKRTGIEIELINNFRESITKYAPPAALISSSAVEKKEEKKDRKSVV